MKISFITDEVTQDLNTIVEFAKKYSLRGVELRSLENTPIDLISINKIKEYKKVFLDNGLEVSNIAGSFYKCYIENKVEVEENLEKLKRLCDIANVLECNSIRGFTFFKTGPLDDNISRIMEAFYEPIKILEVEHKILLLESDPSVFTTNHGQLAKILDLINNRNVAAIYDPGNDIYDEDEEVPFPNGYNLIKKHIRHVHIKDAIKDINGEISCVKIGTGQVDYPGLLHALNGDEFDGWYSMETHYRKQSTISEELMRLPGGSSFSEGGLEATAESIVALKDLMSAEGMIK